MPDVREVFEMTTKQIDPDVDAWRDQEKRQRRSTRSKKVGAFVVAAAIGLGAAIVIWTNGRGQDGNEPAVDPTPTRTAPTVIPAVPYTIELQTGDMTPLPDAIDDGAIYSTSAEGTMLAYSWCCESPSRVFVSKVDGTELREITPEGTDGSGAALSSDGSMLVYQRRDANTQEIGNLVVVDLATGKQRRVTDLEPATYGPWFLNPSFSPDGERIVFQLPRGPADDEHTKWDIWSVPVGGGDRTLEVADASMPAYAPDGRLAYLDAPRGNWGSTRLMVRDTDGTSTVLLEVEGDGIEFPRWSPDGTRIAFQDGDVAIDAVVRPNAISVVDVATGDLMLAAGTGERPAWLDDDTLIVVR